MEKSKFPLVMKSIAALTAAVTLLLLLFSPWKQTAWWLACVLSFGTTAYHFLMRLAVGHLLLKLTDYRFDYRHLWFQPRNWEPAFYKMIQVRKWKGKIPTYAPEQFSFEKHTIHRIIQHMCGAELVHEIIMVLSFLPLLAVPRFGTFYIFLSTSLLAACYDGIFVVAQRYNRPRLVRIYERKEAKTFE